MEFPVKGGSCDQRLLHDLNVVLRIPIALPVKGSGS